MTVWASNLWKINIHTVFPHIVSAHVCTVTFGLMYCSFGFPNPKKNSLRGNYETIWGNTFYGKKVAKSDLCSDEIKPKFLPNTLAGKWPSSVHCLKWWLPQYQRHLLIEWWTTLSCDLRFHEFFSFFAVRYLKQKLCKTRKLNEQSVVF